MRARLAEFALLGLLAFAKRLPELERDKAARTWPEIKPMMRELAGRTVLVVGLGAIGLDVARLAGAFGMRVHRREAHPGAGRGRRRGRAAGPARRAGRGAPTRSS